MTSGIERLEARQAIVDATYRYCRGIDRMDKAVLLSVFHPDALIDYPSFSGGVSDLITRMWATHRTFDMHSHQVTNVLVELDPTMPTRASSEAYVTAALWRGASRPEPGGRGALRVIYGRYIDRWSSRGGQWAVERRICVVDIRSDSRSRDRWERDEGTTPTLRTKRRTSAGRQAPKRANRGE